MKQQSKAGALRVLIVDDDRDTVDSLAELIRAWGHCPIMAYDGFSALRLCQVFRPQVIFLDLAMPGLDGFEVAVRLRSFPAGAFSYLVAVTGYHRVSDCRSDVLADFDLRLLKPVSPAVIRSILDKIVRNRRTTPAEQRDLYQTDSCAAKPSLKCHRRATCSCATSQ
jgi:CheY-like chemotaxis protein